MICSSLNYTNKTLYWLCLNFILLLLGYNLPCSSATLHRSLRVLIHLHVRSIHIFNSVFDFSSPYVTIVIITFISLHKEHDLAAGKSDPIPTVGYCPRHNNTNTVRTCVSTLSLRRFCSKHYTCKQMRFSFKTVSSLSYLIREKKSCKFHELTKWTDESYGPKINTTTSFSLWFLDNLPPLFSRKKTKSFLFIHAH